MPQFHDQPPSVELEAAVAYALALAPALPLDPISKRPLIAHGYYGASADRVELGRWWRKWPNALFALRTGLPGGIAVLDLDPRHGVDLTIADRYATRKHRTRSGGIHAVFLHRSGLRSSVGRIAPGVDVRADPGCVVWWPVHGFEVLCEGPIAEWPDDLAQVIRGAPPSKGEERSPVRGCSPGNSHIRGQADRDIYLSVIHRVPLSGVVTRRVHRRMIGALDVTACKPEGERNAALFWSACQFGEMIGQGLIDWEPARGLLELAAVKCGLDRDGVSQVRATIESGLRRGYDDFTKRTEKDRPVRSIELQGPLKLGSPPEIGQVNATISVGT